MQQYEIRVLNEAMKPTFSVNNGYASDDAAVLFAKSCAGDRAVEVWRESLCVYRAPPSGRRAERAA
jgi:hypothetical protein